MVPQKKQLQEEEVSSQFTKGQTCWLRGAVGRLARVEILGPGRRGRFPIRILEVLQHQEGNSLSPGDKRSVPKDQLNAW